METVFEHNVTNDELINLLGHVTSRDRLVKNLYKQNSHYHMIYDLYHYIRKDEVMAKKYLDKLPNDQHKFFTILNDDLKNR